MEEVEAERNLTPESIESEANHQPEQDSLGLGAMLWGRAETAQEQPSEISTMLWSHETKLKEHEEVLSRHDEVLEAKTTEDPPEPESAKEPDPPQSPAEVNVKFSQYM